MLTVLMLHSDKTFLFNGMGEEMNHYYVIKCDTTFNGLRKVSVLVRYRALVAGPLNENLKFLLYFPFL